MTAFALIRHFPTEWNEEGRLQGRADVPAQRVDQMPVSLRLPSEFIACRCLSSPLARCRSTARRLGLDPIDEPRLIEMDWGKWEGRRLAELRAGLGVAMVAEEAKGLDFRPPGGESPRDVQERVAPLLAEIATANRDTVAITHKGVIRAIYALATGWDMCAEPSHKLSWSAAHLFSLDSGGRPSILELNVPMEQVRW